MLIAAVRNSMLDQLDTLATHASLHTAYSASGANEVTGGSPAYARIARSWSAAASAAKAWAANAAFNVPAGTTVAFVGLWSALSAGTFRGMFPLGSTGYKEVQADVTGNLIVSENHGFVANDRVVFLGGTPPTGLTEGTIYFVISTGLTTDVFAVATTQGGAAIDITGDGGADVVVSKIVPETYNGQGVHTVDSLTVNLS
jgi:hypothetical protein